MTAHRFVTLTCDDCGSVWDDVVTISVQEARYLCTRAGWHSERRGGRIVDVCERHR